MKTLFLVRDAKTLVHARTDRLTPEDENLIVKLAMRITALGLGSIRVFSGLVPVSVETGYTLKIAFPEPIFLESWEVISSHEKGSKGNPRDLLNTLNQHQHRADSIILVGADIRFARYCVQQTHAVPTSALQLPPLEFGQALRVNLAEPWFEVI